MIIYGDVPKLERGQIGIFNRSYYEEILITRIHPEIMEQRQLPPHLINEQIWERRFEEINNFEKYLVNNGTIILKFFLNVSKEEQKERFLERINRPEKNWKFSLVMQKSALAGMTIWLSMKTCSITQVLNGHLGILFQPIVNGSLG